MSIVKRGAYGYGYGQSKPVMNYHTTNPDSVTTVVTEISRLTVNDKPRATLEEVCEEKAGAYSPHHGGAGTVQKHGYSEQKAYNHGSGVGGYGAAPHHDSAGAAQKHGGYGEQKAYQHGVDAVHHDAAAQKQHGYGEHQTYQYGGDVKGYTALHHESAVQKHGYGDGEQKAYQHGSDAVGGYESYDHAVRAVQQKLGYGGQKAYQHGADAGGYGALAHDTTIQKHGYGGEKAYQHGGGAGGYGALHHDSTAQKHGGAYDVPKMYGHAGDGYGGQHKAYQQGFVDGGVGGYDTLAAPKPYGYGGGHKASIYDDVGGFDALVQKNIMQKQKLGYGAGQNAYQPACDGVAGFDALVQNKAMKKQAYGGAYAPGHGAVHHNQTQAAYGKTYKHPVPGVGGALPYRHGSVESDCSSDEESDCEEEPAYVKPGTTHQYSTYERRDENGGRSHYETYQSTTTQGYSGGGYGW